ncbi:MAG: hypothetical protein NVS3B16_22990 [Vulcanimicrobiaceae bacterium]
MEAWLVQPSPACPAAVPRVVAASLFGVLLCGSTALAQPATATGDFGNPPSGEIPILFNDHTVYATPDLLKRNRVLAALVKDGRIYVPLRSMFEQMGATVTATPDGRTVTAVKTGAKVSVTLGKAEVVIDGEPRPLDVPPMLYKGVVLVPVRVISEALGAYVQWVPSRRLVVVRYNPPIPSPPPVAPPTAVPTAAPIVVPPLPTAAPTAVPTDRSYRAFIAAAIASPRNYNEFSAGKYCPEAYMLSGAYAPKDSAVAVKVDFRQTGYVTSDNLTDSLNNHYTRFATIDGGTAFTPVFLARQSSLDARLEYQIAAPRIYLGVSYLHAANNYGYPQLNAFGFGVEKLPDLHSGVNLFGSAFYYPSANGNYTVTNPASTNFGKAYRQQYRVAKYDIGVALVAAHFPVYAYGGFAGDRYTAKQNAPIGQTHDGPYVGLGVKL